MDMRIFEIRDLMVLMDLMVVSTLRPSGHVDIFTWRQCSHMNLETFCTFGHMDIWTYGVGNQLQGLTITEWDNREMCTLFVCFIHNLHGLRAIKLSTSHEMKEHLAKGSWIHLYLSLENRAYLTQGSRSCSAHRVLSICLITSPSSSKIYEALRCLNGES